MTKKKKYGKDKKEKFSNGKINMLKKKNE